jgi:pSer/pThr/pTyr-binding forkhead associated (FHA) protein
MTNNGHGEATASTTAVFRAVPGIDPASTGRPGAADPAAATAVLGSGTLVLTRGTHPRSRFLLGQKVISAGRHPDSAIFLDDVTVSRRHAEFRWLDDEYWIVDVGSLNGTYVNGVQVTSQPLNDGDQIQLGKFCFTFNNRPSR